MSSSPGGSPEGGGGPPRSVLCCPGFVVPGPPAPMAGPGCGLAVLGPGRKRRRGGATLVASAAGRTCRILRLPPAGAGSPPAAGRLVARLEREVGAVALVPSEGGGKSGKGGEESADLFVADRSGRLWRSRGGEGGGWEGGETRPGREPTEVRLAGCLPGPGRGSGRSLGRSGSRDRCLPLGTDLLAAARLPSGEGGGTILVAAGSDALSPPSAILVPAGAEAGTEGVTVAVAAGEVPGLGDAAARTVASLVVPARSLGRGAWSSLVAAAASAGENPPPDGDAPCAAVLLGGEDGTVHCSFVAAAGGGGGASARDRGRRPGPAPRTPAAGCGGPVPAAAGGAGGRLPLRGRGRRRRRTRRPGLRRLPRGRGRPRLGRVLPPAGTASAAVPLPPLRRRLRGWPAPGRDLDQRGPPQAVRVRRDQRRRVDARLQGPSGAAGPWLFGADHPFACAEGNEDGLHRCLLGRKGPLRYVLWHLPGLPTRDARRRGGNK